LDKVVFPPKTIPLGFLQFFQLRLGLNFGRVRVREQTESRVSFQAEWLTEPDLKKDNAQVEYPWIPMSEMIFIAKLHRRLFVLRTKRERDKGSEGYTS
jgi:hypothetical protein